MESQLSEVISLTIYKLACLSSGVVCVYMGYLLFIKGIWGGSGDLEGKFQDTQVVVKNAAPGTIFALVGLFVICFTVVQGLHFPKETETIDVVEVVNPVMPAAAVLPDVLPEP